MIRVMFCVLFGLWATDLRAQPGGGDDGARAFVQQFYDWYVPLTIKVGVAGGKNPQMPDILALKLRPASFDPLLARALRDDRAYQDKHAQDGITGLDWEPFLFSQDWGDPKDHDIYAVRTVTHKDGLTVVHVVGDHSPNGSGGPQVDVVLRQQGAQWVIADFYYPAPPYPSSLLKTLKLYRKQNGLPPLH